MPAKKTLIPNLAVDPALVQDARYKLDAADRQYVDDQIRALTQHLVDSLLTGAIGTWATLDGSSVAVVPGDCVCLASSGTGAFTVTKAVAAALANAGSVAGVVLVGAAPGAKVRVAVTGAVPPSATGLAASSAGLVRCNTTTARCERVAAWTNGDYPIGTVDAAGFLTFIRAPSTSTTISGVTSVGATAPITTTGGTTPTIGINDATLVASGAMSSADKTLLYNATPSNDVSTLVKRGASGEIAVGSIDSPAVDTGGTLALGASASAVNIGNAGATVALTGAITINGIHVDPDAMTGTKTADYTASFGDFVECDPTAAGFTVTPPDPTGNAGRGIIVANLSSSTNAITISLAGKTINGTASYSLATAWTAVVLTAISDGNYFASPAA